MSFINFFTTAVLSAAASCSGSPINLSDDAWVEEGDAANPADVTETNSGEVQNEAQNPNWWCKDYDKESKDKYYEASKIEYLGQKGEVVTLYDECKTTGPNGFLKERHCDFYKGPNTQPSEMEGKYVMCNCQNGACIPDTVVLCTDPEAEVHYPGGSVWVNNEEGKTHLSICESENVVEYLYCNDDGTYHEDFITCDEGIKCGDGMCGGFTCKDMEEAGTDPLNHSEGSLELFNPTTGDKVTYSDWCFGDTVFMHTCPLHTTTELKDMKDDISDNFTKYGDCPEGEFCDEDNGICTTELDDYCIYDSDPDNKTEKKGILTKYDPGCECTEDVDADFCFEDLEEGENYGELYIRYGVWQDNCDDNGLIISTLDFCKAGEKCYDGACMPVTQGDPCELECEESDDGLDILNGGDILMFCSDYYLAKEDDDCVSGTEIKEFYCDGNIPKYSIETCYEGYFCVNDNQYKAYCAKCVDDDEKDNPAKPGGVLDIHNPTSATGG